MNRKDEARIKRAPAASVLHAQIQIEINSNKLKIDRECFSKTPEEKKLIKEAEMHHKHLIATGKVPAKMQRIALVTC